MCSRPTNMMNFGCSVTEISNEFANLDQPIPCRGLNRNTHFKAALNNSEKNRYADVLPYDDSRVKLSKPDDYINASIIPQQALNKTYIAAQAPLPHTFGDFWDMIWEQDVEMIIMLTRFIEKRKVKAHCYWPSLDVTVTFGATSITCTSVVEESDGLTIRTFRLTRGDDSKYVNHYHFLNWPDEGVPSEDNGCFMTLVNFLSQKEGTICIHCSAGIGRTGTLIAIDIIQARLGDSKLRISDVVNELRSHRMGMVQTREQYLFIYSVFFRISGFPAEEDPSMKFSSPNPLSQTSFIPVFD
jgi:protein tyrosine phosphatase